MLGRGTRLHPGKADCLVLDFAGNLERHIPIDGLPEVYERTEERTVSDAAVARAAVARARQRRTREASLLDPFGAPPPELCYTIAAVYATTKPAKGKPGKSNVLVFYRTTTGQTITTWLCPEYDGWARQKAVAWFARRGAVMPLTARECVKLISRLSAPVSIVAVKEKGFDRILVEHFDA